MNDHMLFLFAKEENEYIRIERFFEHRDEKYFDKAHARMIMDEWLYMLRHKS